MKLVDEKGRLFGVINVFDLFVLCIIVSFAFFVIKWVGTAEDPSWSRVKTFYKSYIVETVIRHYLGEHLKEGDKMLNEDGLVVARIEKIISNELANPPTSSDIYISKDGDKISVNSKIVIITSKDGDKSFFRLVKPENNGYSSGEQGSRRITLLVDILVYERQGEIYSCISNTPVKFGQGFVLKTEKYNISTQIHKVLRGEK